MEYLKAINSLLFPSRDWCFFCKEKTIYIKSYICRDCEENISILEKEIDLDSIYIDKSYYLLRYNRFMKKIIHDYKFNAKSYLYKPLGEIMVESILNMNLQKEGEIIYYVPSHKRKEAIRGYNQSELLAKYISDKLKIELSSNNLIKYRVTKAQNKLNRMERIGNLKDSFKLKRPMEVQGKKILLIDDIVTTGSTFIECAKVLKENGADKITTMALTSSKP